MRYLALLFAVAFCFVSTEAHASRVDMLPRKILLENGQHSADLTLLNMGDKPIIIRMSLLSYRQGSNGVYEILEAPLNPAFDPETVVRFSPKQFTLPSGGRQKVRVSIQKPANLPEGEYRFHIQALSFDAEDFSVRRTPIQQGKSVSIKTNVAVAIPVVFRNGSLTSDAKISDVTFVSMGEEGKKTPGLNMNITRTGTASTMGTLVAYNGDKEIGIANNLNVFSEVQTRNFTLPLKEVPSGAIRLIYTNDFGNKEVFDEVVLQK